MTLTWKKDSTLLIILNETVRPYENLHLGAEV